MKLPPFRRRPCGAFSGSTRGSGWQMGGLRWALCSVVVWYGVVWCGVVWIGVEWCRSWCWDSCMTLLFAGSSSVVWTEWVFSRSLGHNDVECWVESPHKRKEYAKRPHKVLGLFLVVMLYLSISITRTSSGRKSEVACTSKIWVLKFFHFESFEFQIIQQEVRNLVIVRHLFRTWVSYWFNLFRTQSYYKLTPFKKNWYQWLKKKVLKKWYRL